MRPPKTFVRLSLLAILTLFLLTSIGCVKRPVIVLNESKTVKIETGQPAPWTGWLLSDGALAELLECCGRSVTNR